VTSRAYKYCPDHTRRERKNFASKAYKQTPEGKSKARDYGREYRKRQREKDPEAFKAKYRALKTKYIERPKQRVVPGDDQHNARYTLCSTCPLWDDCHKKYYGCNSHERAQKIREAGALSPTPTKDTLLSAESVRG
jgi:hypothetical protein